MSSCIEKMEKLAIDNGSVQLSNLTYFLLFQVQNEVKTTLNLSLKMIDFENRLFKLDNFGMLPTFCHWILRSNDVKSKNMDPLILCSHGTGCSLSGKSQESPKLFP